MALAADRLSHDAVFAHSQQEPLILLVPGLHDSGPGHWQTLWETSRPDARRVELGMWDDPHRNIWVNQLNLAIHRANRPVVLVAHSLGCLAVAWWAEYEQPAHGVPVIGALLVAPPDVDRPGADPRLARFSACPRSALPGCRRDAKLEIGEAEAFRPGERVVAPDRDREAGDPVLLAQRGGDAASRRDGGGGRIGARGGRRRTGRRRAGRCEERERDERKRERASRSTHPSSP